MTAILLIAVLAGSLWGMIVLRRGGLLTGCLLVLLAGCCFGHPFFRIHTSPIPLTIDRILWVVLLGQYLLWRGLGRTACIPIGYAELVLCAFVGVLCVSTFTHDWQADGYQPIARLLFNYLMPLGIYFVARQIPLSARSVYWLLLSLAGFGVYLAVTSLAETQGLSWLVYPQYIRGGEYQEFLGRARGPLLNPSASGLLQGLCLGGVLLLWPQTGRAGRLLLVLVALLLGAGVFCTYTRTAWIGAGTGLCLLLGLTLPRSWRGLVLGTTLLVVATLGITQWERILAFKRDRALSAQATADSVELRPILALIAWEMFLDRPLEGCGFAQYANQRDNYVAGRPFGLRLEKARPYVQHNIFLSVLVETGLVGLGLFVLLFALWFRDAWRVWRSPTAPVWARQIALLFFVFFANYLANGMFHDFTLITMAQMLLFFHAGLAAALRPYAAPVTSPLPPGSPLPALGPSHLETRREFLPSR